MSPEPIRALEQLGAEFERAARRAAGPARRRPRLPRRTAVILAIVTALAIAAVALAASGLLTGEPVREPPGVRLAPDRDLGTPIAGSAQLTDVRVPDPVGGPPWGLRTVRTTRGFGCVQVGRVVDGKLGVLGQDGLFGGDGRFHELPPTVLRQANCQPLDGAGQLFSAVSYQGLPAAGLADGCRTGPAPPARLASAAASPPACPAGDLRIAYYGTLGPLGRSVSYRAADGQPVMARARGRWNAYLVVLPVRPGHRARGTFVASPTPLSGLLQVRYRDGSVCRIGSPARLGGARPCPAKGYTAPREPRIAPEEVRTPVRVRVASRPVLPPGAPTGGRVPRQWQLTIVFRARVANSTRAYYTYGVVPTRSRRCNGSMAGSVQRDVPAGHIVAETVYVPASCRDFVRVTVGLHQPHRSPDQLPFMPGEPGNVVVGKGVVRLPRP